MPQSAPKKPTAVRKTTGPRARREGFQAPSSKASYPEIAHKYARDIVDGTIPACLEVRQACKRHLDSLQKSVRRSYPYRFDEAQATFVCDFIEHLPHVKGDWARPRPGHSTLLKLQPWQVWIVCSIFGWLDKVTGYRQFSEVLLLIPRKNGKSALAAGIALYLAFADREYGAEVYCGATSEKQAHEVFGPAWKMTRRSPEFRKWFGVETAAKSIFREGDGSKLQPVVGDPGDGSSPSCAVLDEFHEHRTPALRDTMKTGMGARTQPILLQITTAGTNLKGPCHDSLLDLRKVLAGLEDNPNLFGVNYSIDVDDDWTSEAALRKANPNFGVSVRAEFLLKEQRNAIRSAHLQAIFKTKHLNIWGGAAKGWMNMEAWARCADPQLKLSDFVGQPCYEGVDLAARIDLASRAKLYKDLVEGQVHYYYFGRHYAPKDTIFDGVHQAYVGWYGANRLVAHDGPEIQLAAIEKEIDNELAFFNHVCIAFDQYSAQQMQQALEQKTATGVVLTVPQTVAFLSEPMKEIEAAVLSGRFHHDGDPVMAWAMSNVVVKVDANDNIFPRKERADNKIDPVSALLNAMNRAYTAPAAYRSAYEDRGVLYL